MTSEDSFREATKADAKPNGSKGETNCQETKSTSRLVTKIKEKKKDIQLAVEISIWIKTRNKKV